MQMNNPQMQMNNGMPRPGQPNVANFNHFVNHYRAQQQQGKIPQGWQQSTAPEERGQLAFQFFTQYRLLKPDGPEIETMRTSLQFESQVFAQSQTKDQYVANIKQKLMQMTAARQQQSQRMQPGLGNMNMPMNAMNPGQMNMMGQAGAQGPRQNAPQQFTPGFPNAQLQRPMQISPVPMAQQGSNMGMNVGTPNLNQGQQNQQPNLQQQPQRLPQAQENQFIMQVAKKMFDSCTAEVRQKFQLEVNAWPEEKRQQLIAQGIDPLFLRFRNHAEMLYRNGKVNIQGQQRANPATGQQGGQPNQMQGQQANMAQRQSDPTFDFNAITNQQLGAVRLQDSGAEVVPASNNNNNSAQMGGFGQGGQSQNAAMAQRQAAQAAFQQSLQRQANASQIQVAQAQAQAQQQAQAQARAQIDQQQRAQQAAMQRNQNQILQGQVGGLNLPPGTQPSPAMPMLNRPMNPPGPQGSPNPQQRPPQAHVPQMTPQPGQGQPEQVSALLREAQQRSAAAAALGQTQGPLNDAARIAMMPKDLDPLAQQQLLKVPEQNFRQILANYMTNQRRSQAMQNGLLPGGPGAAGQRGMLPFNQQQGLQPGMAGQMMPNGLPNMANMANMARPGMNLGQQTPGAPGGQPQQPRPNLLTPQRVMAAQQMLQQNPGIIASTDARPFPPEVVSPQVRQSLPPDVKSWGQLKQWAQQNPATITPPETQKLLLLQVIHFQNMLQQQQQHRQQQQQQQMNGGAPQPNNSAGMAPPAPITPGQGQARMPQQALNMASMQVSEQEMQIFRQKAAQSNPQILALNSDQLRQLIIQTKLKNRQQQQQQQQMLAQQQQQQQQQRNLLQQQQSQQQQQQQQHHQQQQPPQQPTQQLNRPPSAQTQPTPQPKPAARPQQAAQPAANANKSLKRPNEDSAEASVDQSGGNAAPQAPMVPQRPLNLTQEQMSKLTPQQQAAVRAQLLKAQDASNAANGKAPQRPLPTTDDLRARMTDPVRAQKLNAISSEVERSLPAGQPTSIPPQVRAQVQGTLQKQLTYLKKVDGAIRYFYASFDNDNNSENVIRSIMTARCLLFREMNHETGVLNDQITLSTEGFKHHLRTVLNFVTKIGQKMAQSQQAQSNAQSNQQQAQSGGDAPLATPPAQLNAANLKQHTESHQRGSKAPQAPTTDRPPFPLGGAQSPSGAPKYFDEAPRPISLVLPDKKRARVDGGSASSTPGPRPSPRMGGGKGSSPELKRQSAADKQTPQKPTFKCKEAVCEYSVRGFDTQSELEAHISIAHTAHDNPLQFALESMAEYLEVDAKTGEAKVNTSKPVAKPAPALASAQRAPAQAIKTEQGTAQTGSTPSGQHAAATPMTRIPTQTGIKNSPSANLLRTPQAMAKVTTPSTGAQIKPTPASAAKSVVKEPAVVVAESAKQQDLQPMLPTSLLDYSYEETFAALDANGPFTVLDLKDTDNTWATRSRPSSPTETPDSSSKDTPSTRQSDISESDNLTINMDVDMPDAWMMPMSGDALPLDMQLSEDLQTLGVSLPPMDSDEMMLFPSLLDFDAVEKQMDGSLAGLDAGIW